MIILPHVKFSILMDIFEEIIKKNIGSYNGLLDHYIVGVNSSQQKLKPDNELNEIIIIIIFVVLLLLIIFTCVCYFYT